MNEISLLQEEVTNFQFFGLSSVCFGLLFVLLNPYEWWVPAFTVYVVGLPLVVLSSVASIILLVKAKKLEKQNLKLNRRFYILNTFSIY